MLYWLLPTTAIVLSILTPMMRCEQPHVRSLMEEVASGCHLVSGLTKEQRRLCVKSPTSAAAALGGIRTAVRECQHQLRWNRWNCSSLESKHYNPHSSIILRRGYKESAFVHAITAAGVAHSVARACSQGLLLNCDCDPRNDQRNIMNLKENKADGSPNQAAYKWKWGGCSHNLDYGITISKSFLDIREKEGDLHSRVNMHNNEAGRLALSNNMEVQCKCHGASGSCQLKTCWRSSPNFRVVGKQLKKRYQHAIRVGQSNKYNSLPRIAKKHSKSNDKPRKRKRGGGKKKWRKLLKPTDALLYYEPSPTYCESDAELDVWGTTGRRCSRANRGSVPGSCSYLCCGRGHDQLRIITKQQCRCQFIWCCRVDCDTCVQDEYVAVCK